jgi:hypothetical protein
MCTACEDLRRCTICEGKKYDRPYALYVIPAEHGGDGFLRACRRCIRETWGLAWMPNSL